MELRISRVGTSDATDEKNSNPHKAVTSEVKEVFGHTSPLETADLGGGIQLHRQGERYMLSVDGQMLEISEEEACRVYENPDSAYDVVIRRRRRFDFSASVDSVGMINHEIDF